MKLSRIYMQKDLLVGSNEVAIIDKIERRGYMDQIKAEVSANDNVEVTLLIGANNVKALQNLLELIASKNRGSYALETPDIVGPMHNQNKSEKLRAVVRFVATALPCNHYSSQSDKVRKTSVEELLMKIYENAFVGPQLQHIANKMNVLENSQIFGMF